MFNAYCVKASSKRQGGGYAAVTNKIISGDTSVR